MFLNTIPYNFYALTTLLMIIIITTMQIDYGPMKLHEANASAGDLFTTADRPFGDGSDQKADDSKTGGVIDLVIPVAVLILFCVFGMVYTGGFFEGVDFITAFADADASVGLVYGSIITLIFTFCFYMTRRVLTFKQFTDCIPEGFKAMVAPILILTMAWTLSGMTGLLGAKYYIHDLVEAQAGGLQMFLPALIFLVAVFLAFATGTSWGTFSILIPIVCNVFADSPDTYQMLVISIAACLAGAVCGDHCSPISDTTIMASAGAQSNHINHVATQLPYALTAAAVSCFGFLLAGILGYKYNSNIAMISCPISLGLMVVVLFVIRSVVKRK